MGRRKFAEGDLIKEKWGSFGYIRSYTGDSVYDCIYVDTRRVSSTILSSNTREVMVCSYPQNSRNLEKRTVDDASRSLNAAGVHATLRNYINNYNIKYSIQSSVSKFRKACRLDKNILKNTVKSYEGLKEFEFPSYEELKEYEITGWWRRMSDLERRVAA